MSRFPPEVFFRRWPGQWSVNAVSRAIFRLSLESYVSLVLPCPSSGVLNRDDGDFTVLYEVLVEIESCNIRRKVVNEDVDEGVCAPVEV
jgi:hypothetical protein